MSVSRHRSAYNILFGNSGDNKSVGRLRYTREVDINTNLKVTGCGSVDWIHLAHKLVPGSCDNEFQGSIKSRNFFLRRNLLL
jgi:hypothetical protein